MRASPLRPLLRLSRLSPSLRKSPPKSSSPRSLKLSLRLLPLLQALRRPRSRPSTVRAVAEADVAEVAVAGEATVKAVDVAAEAADLDRTVRTPMASSRRLVRSQFAAAEAEVNGAANGAVAAEIVVTVVTVVTVATVAIADNSVDPATALEVVLAPRMRAQPSPPKRPPRLNPSNPLNRFE